MKSLYLFLVLFFSISVSFGQQGLTGKYLKLLPSTLPTACSTGDMRFDSTGHLVNYCYPSNTWNAFSFSSTAPMTTLGDLLYENGTPAPTRLAGNTSSTKKFLSQTGTGTVSAAPAWSVLSSGDIPDLSSTYVLRSGSVQLTGNWDVGGYKLQNLATPASTADAATKGYVDTASTTGNAGNVTGTVAVANGGTGQTSLTSHGVLIGNGTSGVNAATQTTLGYVLISQLNADPVWTQGPVLGSSVGAGTGSLKISGGTSGWTFLTVPASGSNVTWTFPGSFGSSGNGLKTDGSGNTSWTSFINADGTVPLTANWSVGSFKIQNVTDPASAQDAATKNYVDTAIKSTASGGTGANLTPAIGGIVYGSTTSAMAVTAAGTSGQILTSGGAGAPTWTSTLPMARGGTGNSLSAVAGGIVYSNSTGLQVLAAGTSGQVLKSGGAGTPTWGSGSSVTPVQCDTYLTGGNGYGSTNTKIRRFTTVTTTCAGGQITVTQSSTNGDSITINTAGHYCFWRKERSGTADYAGISVNSTQLTTNLDSITDANIGCGNEASAADQICTYCKYFSASDVIRAHDRGTSTATTAGDVRFWGTYMDSN